MSNHELVPVQSFSRHHVIGAPEPEVSVHYFTAVASIDADVLARHGTKLRVTGLPAPTVEEVLKARSAVKLWNASRCTAVRDLLEGTPDAGQVIQFCEKEHHMDVLAHRMTNVDGSTTTWRR
ncbi:hypothetical protein [Arthrobacter sp. UYCo732]|uniref:hypothetical protein n=1 Tax=Arthrobacter sp. UYCo732 TaxID=3156336 RepID=UPI0033973675